MFFTTGFTSAPFKCWYSLIPGLSYVIFLHHAQIFYWYKSSDFSPDKERTF